jgi:hypothetical protein
MSYQFKQHIVLINESKGHKPNMYLVAKKLATNNFIKRAWSPDKLAAMQSLQSLTRKNLFSFEQTMQSFVMFQYIQLIKGILQNNSRCTNFAQQLFFDRFIRLWSFEAIASHEAA